MQAFEDLNCTLCASPSVPFDYSTMWDSITGAILIVCTLVGTPLNIIALSYFITEYKLLAAKPRSNKQFFNDIYIMIVVNDLAICSTVFPVAFTLFNDRGKFLFEEQVFCGIWAVIWEILPFLSIFLVGLLSFSRMLTLFHPLKIFNRCYIKAVVILYVLLVVLLKGVPVLVHLQHPSHDTHANETIFDFNKFSSYCFLFVRDLDDDVVWDIYASTCSILMALPIPFIVTSCAVSLYKIHQSVARSRSVSSSVKMQRYASVTVAIVTITYILYNIPVFINYLFFMMTSFRIHYISYQDFYANNSFTWWYFWVWTYIVLVALNALSNPVVYFMRMNGFHHYVNSTRVSSYLSSGIRSLSQLSSSSVREANKMRLRVMEEETDNQNLSMSVQGTGTAVQVNEAAVQVNEAAVQVNEAAVEVNGAAVDTNNDKLPV